MVPFRSPCVRESKTVLDSGFQVQEVDSLSVELGFQIPWALFQKPRVPDSISKTFPDSGLHKQKFPGFQNLDSLTWGPGGGGVLLGILGGGCAARFFKSWPDFRPNNVIFHTRFQTRSLKSIPVFRPGFRQKFCYQYFWLDWKQKYSSNPFRVRIFLFLSHSFGIETINTFLYSEIPSKTIPDSRPKWAKCIPVFRPKRRKNPTWRGGKYLYGLYTGVPPPPLPGMGRA